jgi:methionine sulfoxide reductase heme-binding subunit
LCAIFWIVLLTRNKLCRQLGKVLSRRTKLAVDLAWQDRNRRFSWLKAGTFALVLMPAIRFAYQFASGEYGPLPISLGGMIYWSGVWATVLLLMALAVTPALTILRWPALVDVRRMIGVTALAYTLAHTVVYFALRSWNFRFIVNEKTRLSMIVATLSTIGLIVLGATSLDAAIKRMGAKGWQRLTMWSAAWWFSMLYWRAVPLRSNTC